MINGTNHDFEDLKIYLNGAPMAELTEVNYSDEQEVEEQYGAGSRPIAFGRGNYKASGGITLTRNEYDKLRALAVAAGKTIFDFNPFQTIVTYGAKSAGDDGFVESSHSPLNMDTLVNCVFIKRTFAASQNDKGNTVKLDMIIEKVMPG